MTDVNDFLMGGGGAPSAKFPTIGTLHKGTITETAVSQQTSLEGDPKVWPDGNPMMQAVITIQTDERDMDIDDDEGLRRLFVKGQMQAAVREAVRASGASKLEIGGTLAVIYDSDGERKSPGHNPPKIYRAQYVPPVGAVNDLLGTDSAPTPQAAAVPASNLL